MLSAPPQMGRAVPDKVERSTCIFLKTNTSKVWIFSATYPSPGSRRRWSAGRRGRRADSSAASRAAFRSRRCAGCRPPSTGTRPGPTRAEPAPKKKQQFQFKVQVFFPWISMFDQLSRIDQSWSIFVEPTMVFGMNENAPRPTGGQG